MWVETHQSFALDASDTLIIASDGLWDNLPVSEVVQMVVDGDLGEVGHNLAAAVSQRMVGAEPGMPSKPDDLSFILFSRRGAR
jgi:serine/threonine protein phosphatase PrpC